LAKRSRFSRFRRLPGLHRVGERREADPALEPTRLSLYLPGTVLDRAEALALRAGFETVQQYCEQLLERAIEMEHAREVMEQSEAKRGPLEGFDEVANDPEYLAEWNASAALGGRKRPLREERDAMPEPNDGKPSGDSIPGHPPTEPNRDAPAPGSSAADVVLRHAGMRGADPAGFLSTLRRGEPVVGATAQELLRALSDLEVEHRGASFIERRLAYGLHRLAFEGQVLLTDAWPGTVVDEGTVDVLRVVQEAVDRVLSGEDIRYFSPSTGGEPPL
jgi:hypothetical protein